MENINKIKGGFSKMSKWSTSVDCTFIGSAYAIRNTFKPLM